MVLSPKLSPTLPSHRFLVVDENRFAYVATERLAEESFPVGDPIAFLFGPAGAGKSHLVTRFVREYSRKYPKQKVLQATASEFAAEFAEAASSQKILEFQEHYRTANLFVCEDIQALTGRYASQQQLLAVINELVAVKARIIITATKPPGQLRGLSSRLINRLRGGLYAPIELPGRESRLLLLRHFASSSQVAAPSDAIELLASSSLQSPRELLAALLQLDSASRKQRKPIDTQAVRRFAELNLQSNASPPSLTTIVKIVAKEFSLKPSEIRSPSRRRGVAQARQCAMYLGRELSGEPLRIVAEYFHRRSHGSVIHACERIERRLTEDRSFHGIIKDLIAQLRTPNRRYGQ